MFWPTSTSLTWFATTVTLHVIPAGRLEVGVSTKLEAGEAGDTVNATGVPVGHSSLNAVPVTFTGSLKLIVTVVLGDTLVAPLVGTVEVTVGAASTVKLAVKSAVMCWPASTSVTWAATTVTVQTTPLGKGDVGCSTKLVAGEGVVTEKATGVPVGHSSLNAEAVTLTDSLKFTVTVELGATPQTPLVD